MFPADDWWRVATRHDDGLNKEESYDDFYGQITGINNDDQATDEMLVDDDKVNDDFNSEFEDDQRWADDIMHPRLDDKWFDDDPVDDPWPREPTPTPTQQLKDDDLPQLPPVQEESELEDDDLPLLDDLLPFPTTSVQVASLQADVPTTTVYDEDDLSLSTSELSNDDRNQDDYVSKLSFVKENDYYDSTEKYEDDYYTLLNAPRSVGKVVDNTGQSKNQTIEKTQLRDPSFYAPSPTTAPRSGKGTGPALSTPTYSPSS